MALTNRTLLSVGIVLSLLFVPAVNSSFAQIALNTTSINNTTSTTSSNLTSTGGTTSTGSLGLPLPNDTISVNASTTVAGVKVFGNGTISTSVNGVAMSFFFDPHKPSAKSGTATGPNSVNLTVDTYDLSGNEITGVYIEIQDSTGKDLATGYSPANFSLTSGQQYTVYANDYQNTVFNHWDNGSTNPARQISISTNTVLSAFYSTGSSSAPQPPTGLAASAVSASQINLSWTAPSNNGGSPVTGYKIERSLDGGSTWSTLVANTASAATSYSDSGLQSGTTYTYRVSAINSAGTSTPSNTAQATTGGSTSTTGGISLNKVASTSATVSSSPFQVTLPGFAAGNGTDRLLVVGISANSNNVASVTFGGVPLTQAASSFYNNDAEFWYLKNPSGTGDVVVSMAGKTSAVVGAYAFSGVDQSNPVPTTASNHNTAAGSPSISITTAYPNSFVLDLPAIYGGVTLSNPTCTQQWDSNIPGAITGASSSAIEPSPGSASCSWTASSGDQWDDIALEIKSDPVQVGTASAPGSPTGLSATSTSSTQVNLSWTAPSNNGGSPVTGYKIERSLDGGSTWSTVTNTGSTATAYSDTGLQPSTTYTYRVSATNSAGTGTPSGDASATTSAPPTAGVAQSQSGLVASDSLTNETESQQQLQSSPGYWQYTGDAPSENAPYQFSRDTSGLHIGVQAPKDGTWAGFFAESPNTNAELFHSVITTPLRALPSNEFYNNGMYVQTANGYINYVTCVALTNDQATVWAVISSTGNYNQATTETVLAMDNSANQPLTRDCTIITNGNNYLKVYLDGSLFYSSGSLNLQMPAPFNVYLEPETSYAGQLLTGTFTDYYVTSNEAITAENLPGNAATISLVESSGTVLNSTGVSGGSASLEIGQYHFPIKSTLNAYDSSHNLVASGAVSAYGGDLYSAK